MKRVFSFLLIVALLLGCTACGGRVAGAAGVDHQGHPLRGEEPQVPSNSGGTAGVTDGEEGPSGPKEPDVQ